MPNINEIPEVNAGNSGVPDVSNQNILNPGLADAYNPLVNNIAVDSNTVNYIGNLESQDVGNQPIGNQEVSNQPIGNQDVGVRPSGEVGVRESGVRDAFVNSITIADRSWMASPPQAIPVTVPVTITAGTPIVDIPGCVKVHKENAKNPASKNKQLVNDDPDQNVVLCDGGMPYYVPPDYDYRDLSWQTVYNETEQEPEGLDTEPDDIEAPEPPPPPETPPQTAEDVPCPPPNARRIGDLNQAGTEKVSGYKLSPDKTVCITEWEDIGFAEQYLPSVAVITTTAGIAAVATTSALLAKPLADLLLKVVKPVIKKVIAKVKEKVLKKKPPVLSDRERRLKQKELNAAVKAARMLKGN